MKITVTFVLLFLLACSSVIQADEVEFNKQIRQIFRERCIACHGALKQEASLRLDSATHLHKGGDSGEVIELENPIDSELLSRITDPDESVRMPPEGKPLSESEVALILEWIKQGAKIPKDDFAEDSPQDHWAFNPPVKTKLKVHEPSQVIDTLLERRRSAAGVKEVAGRAAKRRLLRRVYLDLIGVPPTLKEQQDFLGNQRNDAFEQVVDRLLASPHYGERWGRHWMDVWRYSDWYGLGAQLRYSQKHLWHWRDWIIESLNEDKGYDQFIREMLAADELYPLDRNRIRGTGFLARNYYLFNRTTWLDGTLEHTSKAFLGLTLNCAKCHDHKYDPLSQQDYYRMRAIFEPHQVRLDPLPGNVDLEKDGMPRVFDAHPEAKTFVHRRGNEKDPDKSSLVQPGSPDFFDFQILQPTAIVLPVEAANPALQPFVLRDRIEAANREIATLQKELDDAKLNLARSLNRTEKKTPKYDSVKLQTEGRANYFLNDSFDTLNPKLWTIKDGKWRIDQGRLVQSVTGATRKLVETHKDHPQDFILETVLSVSGGDMWKSFGISFDSSASHQKTVYLSAYSDSKIQISHSENGMTVYPANGLVKMPIRLNQPYRLRIAIRNQLINVALDGKHLLAFEFPAARRAGKIQLMSFDSVASFDSIHVGQLSDTTHLYPSGNQGTLTPEQAKLNLQLLNAKLDAAKLKVDKLKSSYEADLAQARKEKNADKLIRRAALTARRFEHSTTQAAVVELELKLASAKATEKSKLAKSLELAKNNFKSAAKKLRHPGTSYESIRASRKALEGPAEKPASRNQPFPKTSTGRRTAFANWIVHRKNPLTARVAVNHIWMRHFGKPLVEPVTDFGRRTKAPLQQELLDWLAADFMDNGWRMKRLHKQIILSDAYQMASTPPVAKPNTLNNPAGRRGDFQNPDLYTFRSPIRMESQVIRDSLLRLSGTLEERLGGPPVDPNSQTKRRSLYFRQSRDHQNKFVGMFDDADILRCYRRQESIIPQQALTLANSKLAFEAAQRISRDLSQKVVNETEEANSRFIELAFLTVLGREPTNEELQLTRQTLLDLKQLTSQRPDSLERSRINIVLALINSNDFVTVR